MLDRIYLFYLVIQPVINKLLLSTSSSLSLIDEILILVFGVVFLCRTINKGKIKTKYLYFVLPALYLIFTWFYNSLPAYNTVQIFLYLQVFVIYIYFNSLSYIKKYKLFCFFYNLVKIIFFVSIPFVFINIIEPDYIKKLLGLPILEKRGLGGLSIVSFYGTRTGYSQFLIIFLVLVLFNKNINKKNKYFFIVGSFLLVLLTFSRKEVLVASLFLIAYLWKKGKSTSLKLFIPTILAGVLSYYYLNYFENVNKAALKESYVRWRIIDYSFQISRDFFPFGSGPGTFGSQLSMDYQRIYDLYNVPEAITGTKVERGPIYDSFLFSFLAEIGIGIFLYIGFYYRIYKSELINFFQGQSYLKLFLLASILLLSFFTPIIMNPVGLSLIVILALINK